MTEVAPKRISRGLMSLWNRRDSNGLIDFATEPAAASAVPVLWLTNLVLSRERFTWAGRARDRVVAVQEVLLVKDE
jgi:hypothetical protein